MSGATDHTTGSFKRALPDKSQSYVQTVRRLVKKFTLPITARAAMRPLLEEVVAPSNWINDEDAPPALQGGPYPLPGDFMSFDISLQHQWNIPGSGGPVRRWYEWFSECDEANVSPWISRNGLTPYAHRILTCGLAPPDFAAHDAFNNTLLHFLAARGPLHLLFQAVESELSGPILNTRNTAGQTFLHVIDRLWFTANPHLLCQLLDELCAKGFDMTACDHYGRNIFHVLLAAGCPREHLAGILPHCGSGFFARRDAFGVIPMLQQVPGHGFTGMEAQFMHSSDSEFSDDPQLSKESRLLELVRLASESPDLEDESGRNGLHCLAMSALSKTSAVIKASSQPSARTERQAKRTRNPEFILDSSSERLNFRLTLAKGLLEAGVDPNHRDKFGNTPLMAFAAELPESDDYKTPQIILELLLSHGADVHARNRAGETALHIAVRCGRKIAMRTLVECDGQHANVHVRDSAGRGVLEVADAKIASLCEEDQKLYAHFEACRAWLSGENGGAVQSPTILQEWGTL